MLTNRQKAGLLACFAAAKAAGHPFPSIAAAEGAVESATQPDGWFTSSLYVKSNNYLGLKAPSWYTGMVVEMPTREFVRYGAAVPREWKNPRMQKAVQGGSSWVIDSEFVHCNSLTECGRLQMQVLQRNYAEAFDCTTPEDFARVVSAKWSTGPERGDEVVAIYHAHLVGPASLLQV